MINLRVRRIARRWPAGTQAGQDHSQLKQDQAIQLEASPPRRTTPLRMQSVRRPAHANASQNRVPALRIQPGQQAFPNDTSKFTQELNFAAYEFPNEQSMLRHITIRDHEVVIERQKVCSKTYGADLRSATHLERSIMNGSLQYSYASSCCCQCVSVRLPVVTQTCMHVLVKSPSNGCCTGAGQHKHHKQTFSCVWTQQVSFCTF